MKQLWIFILAALCCTAAQAKDIGGEYAVHGVGAEPCTQYSTVRAQNGNLTLEYEIWLSGFFSAFNLIVSNTYSIMGERGMDEFLVALDDYCAQRPDELFITAISTVTMVVFPDRRNLSPYVDRWPSLLEETQGESTTEQ